MRDASVYPPAGGWVITDQGREDWRTLPLCECKPALRDGWIVCVECGTVYAAYRDLNRIGPVYSRKRD